MAGLTKQQAAPQAGPNMWPLFPLLDLTYLSGAMKKTAVPALVAMQFGLMKFSCLLKQKLFPPFLPDLIIPARYFPEVQPSVGGAVITVNLATA